MVSFLTNAALWDVKAQVGAFLRSLETPAAMGKSVKKIQVNLFLLNVYSFGLCLQKDSYEYLTQNPQKIKL